MSYSSLYSFNGEGLARFDSVFTSRQLDYVIDPTDPSLTTRVLGTGRFSPVDYDSAKDMARSILCSLGQDNVTKHLSNYGLWAWLIFALRHQLFAKDVGGQWKVGERHRWYPSSPNDWQKSQRHLVRMPVQLLHSFRDDADHLLCGAPNALPDIREQLTSRKDMFSTVFLQVGRSLYFDDTKGRLKPGAGGKSSGSPRRLARLQQQLDVTWDLDDLEPEQIISMLPPEFDRFRPIVSI